MVGLRRVHGSLHAMVDILSRRGCRSSGFVDRLVDAYHFAARYAVVARMSAIEATSCKEYS